MEYAGEFLLMDWLPNSHEPNQMFVVQLGKVDLGYITTTPKCMGTKRPPVDIMVPDITEDLLS